MPSRLSTPSPPSFPSSIATCGETTPSMADAITGSSSRCGPSFQPMSTSCGSRVRREGTIAMSSNPYAWRAFLPLPISISMPQPLQAIVATPEDGESLLNGLQLGDLDAGDELTGL